MAKTNTTLAQELVSALLKLGQEGEFFELKDLTHVTTKLDNFFHSSSKGTRDDFLGLARWFEFHNESWAVFPTTNDDELFTSQFARCCLSSVATLCRRLHQESSDDISLSKNLKLIKLVLKMLSRKLIDDDVSGTEYHVFSVLGYDAIASEIEDGRKARSSEKDSFKKALVAASQSFITESFKNPFDFLCKPSSSIRKLNQEKYIDLFNKLFAFGAREEMGWETIVSRQCLTVDMLKQVLVKGHQLKDQEITVSPLEMHVPSAYTARLLELRASLQGAPHVTMNELRADYEQHRNGQKYSVVLGAAPFCMHCDPQSVYEVLYFRLKKWRIHPRSPLYTVFGIEEVPFQRADKIPEYFNKLPVIQCKQVDGNYTLGLFAGDLLLYSLTSLTLAPEIPLDALQKVADEIKSFSDSQKQQLTNTVQGVIQSVRSFIPLVVPPSHVPAAHVSAVIHGTRMKVQQNQLYVMWKNKGFVINQEPFILWQGTESKLEAIRKISDGLFPEYEEKLEKVTTVPNPLESFNVKWLNRIDVDYQLMLTQLTYDTKNLASQFFQFDISKRIMVEDKLDFAKQYIDPLYIPTVKLGLNPSKWPFVQCSISAYGSSDQASTVQINLNDFKVKDFQLHKFWEKFLEKLQQYAVLEDFYQTCLPQYTEYVVITKEDEVDEYALAKKLFEKANGRFNTLITKQAEYLSAHIRINSDDSGFGHDQYRFDLLSLACLSLFKDHRANRSERYHTVLNEFFRWGIHSYQEKDLGDILNSEIKSYDFSENIKYKSESIDKKISDSLAWVKEELMREAASFGYCSASTIKIASSVNVDEKVIASLIDRPVILDLLKDAISKQNVINVSSPFWARICKTFNLLIGLIQQDEFKKKVVPNGIHENVLTKILENPFEVFAKCRSLAGLAGLKESDVENIEPLQPFVEPDNECIFHHKSVFSLLSSVNTMKKIKFEPVHMETSYHVNSKNLATRISELKEGMVDWKDDSKEYIPTLEKDLEGVLKKAEIRDANFILGDMSNQLKAMNERAEQFDHLRCEFHVKSQQQFFSVQLFADMVHCSKFAAEDQLLSYHFSDMKDVTPSLLLEKNKGDLKDKFVVDTVSFINQHMNSFVLIRRREQSAAEYHVLAKHPQQQACLYETLDKIKDEAKKLTSASGDAKRNPYYYLSRYADWNHIASDFTELIAPSKRNERPPAVVEHDLIQVPLVIDPLAVSSTSSISSTSTSSQV
jgi:hypothetical protein